MKTKAFVSINGSKPKPLGMIEAPDFEELRESVCTPMSNIVDEFPFTIGAKTYSDIFRKRLEDTRRKENDCILDKIDHIITNPPATIILWKDDSKTVVKCMDGDEYDVEQGIAMCLLKKLLSDNGYHSLKKIMHNESNKYENKNAKENES